MTKAYRAVLVKEAGSPDAPPALIWADHEADAVAQILRILGRQSAFDLLQDGRLVLRHRPPGEPPASDPQTRAEDTP